MRWVVSCQIVLSEEDQAEDEPRVRKKRPEDEEDDAFVRSIIDTIFTKFDKAKLIDLELYKENVADVLTDLSAEPFTKIPLNRRAKIPRNGKLKLHVTIREPGTERDITGVATVPLRNGRLVHTDKVETPELDTLPDEADNQKKISQETVKKASGFLLKMVQSLVSVVNILVNMGWFGVEG